jgi:hypothetical protein
VRSNFSLRGLDGQVDIELTPVADRDAVGSWPAPPGLPACEATISYPGRGYHGIFGWVQLVRSTDNNSGGREYEMDPLGLLGDVDHPFCFFGIRPTLFDAPSRDPAPDIDWLAHSFLAIIDWAQLDRVIAILGFSWGFRLTEGRAEITPVMALDAAAWDGHLDLFARTYPAWTFAPGFNS